MKLQLIPRAVGQSEEVLVFWDDNPDIGMVLPRKSQLVSELKWGAGTIDGERCLILYLFIGRQVVELHLLRELPTSPGRVVDVWNVIYRWRPKMFKVRYGESPVNRDKEVELLLPAAEGERLTDKLHDFAKSLRLHVHTSADRVVEDSLNEWLKSVVDSTSCPTGEPGE